VGVFLSKGSIFSSLEPIAIRLNRKLDEASMKIKAIRLRKIFQFQNFSESILILPFSFHCFPNLSVDSLTSPNDGSNAKFLKMVIMAEVACPEVGYSLAAPNAVRMAKLNADFRGVHDVYIIWGFQLLPNENMSWMAFRLKLKSFNENSGLLAFKEARRQRI
jgi:hypothetical protein